MSKIDELMADVSNACKDSAKGIDLILKDNAELRSLLARLLNEFRLDIEAGVPLDQVVESMDAEATLLLSAATARLGEKQIKIANTMKEFLDGVLSIIVKHIMLAMV